MICRDLTPIPLTPIIIQTVEELAGQDKSKVFNIHGHNGAVLYDTMWIDGVHYTDQVTKQRQLQSKTNQSKWTNICKDTTKSNQQMVSQDSTTNQIFVLYHGAYLMTVLEALAWFAITATLYEPSNASRQ